MGQQSDITEKHRRSCNLTLYHDRYPHKFIFCHEVVFLSYCMVFFFNVLSTMSKITSWFLAHYNTKQKLKKTDFIKSLVPRQILHNDKVMFQ